MKNSKNTKSNVIIICGNRTYIENYYLNIYIKHLIKKEIIFIMLFLYIWIEEALLLNISIGKLTKQELFPKYGPHWAARVVSSKSRDCSLGARTISI